MAPLLLRKRQAMRNRRVLISLGIVAATLLVYGQLMHHGFVDLDDTGYVVENPYVRAGLTMHGVAWAFTTGYLGYWMPLSWLSLMADSQLYGMNAGGYHLTSLCLHIVNALLLLFVLRAMTGAFWRSALVAALFALHPLRVESVAWVAERKDVLSAFFGFLALGSYVAYARRPCARRLALVGVWLGLGLMAKPMLVTLPFVFLLLDYWPLGRLGYCAHQPDAATPPDGRTSKRRTLSRLVIEKIPLAAMGAVASGVTVMLAARAGAVADPHVHPLGSRLANAVVSYVRYLGKALWPTDLAAFYPYPERWPAWQVLGSVLLLLALGALAFAAGRRSPYLRVGWLWFVATLLPVIGVVQAGEQAMADRFTYFPLVGLFVAVVWSLHDLARRLQMRAPALGACAFVVVAALGFASWRQVAYWKDTEQLLTHAVRVTSGNWLAHNNLGGELLRQGRVDEAIEHFNHALDIYPDYADPEFGLGVAMALEGRTNEAILHYTQAVRLEPDFANAHNNLGLALLSQWQVGPAVDHLAQAVRLRPASAEMHFNLGLGLSRRGEKQEAIAHFSRAVRLKPDFAEAHHELAAAGATTHEDFGLPLNPELAARSVPREAP